METKDLTNKIQMEKGDNENKQKEWLVIVNPNAGNGKSRKDWPRIRELLLKEGFSFESIFTEYHRHAIDIAREHIQKGFKKIIVVGGDGTLNEVVNGIFRQKVFPTADISLGMIGVGTGNDWGRTFSMPADYAGQVSVLSRGRLFLQDACKVTFAGSGGPSGRFFINMAGIGFDALVAKKTNLMKEKGRGGTLSYLTNLFFGLYEYTTPYININVDGSNVFRGKAFSINVGICKYNGGGMMQSPDAIPDDGLIDLTIIEEIPKYLVVRHVKKLYTGKFVDLPFVKQSTGREFIIESDPAEAIFLETDGESLGHAPFQFKIIPASINVFVP